ncbi:hypothetical protein DUE52_31710 [Larkinella punicea]|uniref:Uncharacterized protein n=1 Tax=Larkinella punicea TaxID=2315727 RepID=A0A368JCT6_9BACT|nr:hypothetical protein DUE52_31710 [Larkinella punicea]
MGIVAYLTARWGMRYRVNYRRYAVQFLRNGLFCRTILLPNPSPGHEFTGNSGAVAIRVFGRGPATGQFTFFVLFHVQFRPGKFPAVIAEGFAIIVARKIIS